MNRSALSGSALGAILLAAALLMRVPATAPTSSASSTSVQTKQAAAPAGQTTGGPGGSQAREQTGSGPWDASRRHFAGIGTEGLCDTPAAFKAVGKGKASPKQATPGQASGKQKTNDTEREKLWCIPRDEQVRAMMAIVPDPVHSQMSLVYDRSVEALQLAAESVGYVIDRYWLPWDMQSAKSASGPATARDAGEQESEPGLLMFRWNGDSRQNGEPKNTGASMLYVFLVTDTSTAGIQGVQFSRAVKYIHQVCGGAAWTGCGGKSSIRVMGPTFSGSLDSLRRLTERSGGQAFRVYSGTVSSKQALDSQHLTDRRPSPCAEDKDCKDPPLVFQSLVTDTETAVERFVKSLQEEKHILCEDRGHPEVAIFSEAATTYGEAARTGRAAPEASQGDAQDIQACYANFSYPREIASLRNAYQQAGRQPSSQDAGSAATAQNYLPFSLADQQPNRGDEPPMTSLHQGPLSQEAVLMKYAAELRRQHYRYVGIIGSNVLDVLFLASFLRNACPDVRVFAFSSDLLMERDSDNVPYIGMLALSTYPLIARNLYWTGPDPRLSRLPFADQYQEGTFNAAFLAMHEVVPQISGGGLYETWAPFTERPASLGTQKPGLPLWVSAVGTSGFWPVRILTPDLQDNAPSSPPVMTGVDFTGAWKGVSAVFCAVAFLYVLVLWTVPPLGSRFRDFAVTGPVCGQRLFFINLISINLALGLAMAATPAWRFGLSAGPSIWIIGAAAFLAITALFLSSVGLCNVCCGAWREQDASASRAGIRLRTGGIALGLWIAAFLCECLWWRLFTDDPSHYGFFFAYRAVHMATGVSPFTPMLPLFAAFCIWSTCELLRLRFNEQLRPRLGVPPGFPGDSAETPIARSLFRYLLKPNYVVAFVLIFAVWLLFFKPLRPFQLFEKPPFGLLYELLFCVVVMLMLSAGLRLGQLWTDTRKLLDELQRSPIRHAFSRLKGASWSPIWQSGGQDAEWLNMARSYEVLGKIKLSCNAMGKALNEKIAAAEKARQEIFTLRNEFLGPAPEAGKPSREFFRTLQTKFSTVQTSLQGVLGEALKALKEYWEEYGPGEDEPPEDQAQAKSRDDKPVYKPVYIARLEEFVALRYVAFIRAILMHVKHLLILQAAVYSLVLISLNLYSFEPHQSLIWSFTAIFALIGMSGVLVLIQAHRDEILSRVTGTKPNELGIGFYLRVLSLGAAPLVTLLATHFPAIGKLFWSIFQPGIEALK